MWQGIVIHVIRVAITDVLMGCHALIETLIALHASLVLPLTVQVADVMQSLHLLYMMIYLLLANVIQVSICKGKCAQQTARQAALFVTHKVSVSLVPQIIIYIMENVTNVMNQIRHLCLDCQFAKKNLF